MTFNSFAILPRCRPKPNLNILSYFINNAKRRKVGLSLSIVFTFMLICMYVQETEYSSLQCRAFFTLF